VAVITIVMEDNTTDQKIPLLQLLSHTHKYFGPNHQGRQHHRPKNTAAWYVPGRHGSISAQIIYKATIQTSCNNNRFIMPDVFNVLKTLLILARAAILLT
jgi:hypothetical protein